MVERKTDYERYGKLNVSRKGVIRERNNEKVDGFRQV
jgi:hypothetical protein